MKRLVFNRFIGGIILIFVIACGIILGSNYYNEYLEKQKSFAIEQVSTNSNLSRSATLLISEIMLPEKELIKTVVQKLQNMDLYDDKIIKEFVIDRSAGFTNIGRFYFVRSDGKQFINLDIPSPTGHNPTERPWYVQAVNNRGIIVTKPYEDWLTGGLCISIASPVYQDGNLMGVVGLDIFIDKFQSILINLSADHRTHYFITDYYGNIITSCEAQKPGSNISMELKNITTGMNINTIIENQDWHSILKNLNGVIDIAYSDREKITGYYYTMQNEKWKVIAITDPVIYSSEMAHMKTMFYSFGSIGILLFLILILTILGVHIYTDRTREKFIFTHDVLTGLPNRQYLDIYFNSKISQTEDNVEYALYLIDIDNFKFVNDVYGRMIGDELIKVVSNILRNIVPSDGLLIKSGEDEFGILLSNISIESAKYFSERLQGSISDNSIQVLNNTMEISISTGYTVFNNPAEINRFFSLANTALEVAKDEGKNKAVCILPEDENTNIKDSDKINRLISAIKNALRENRFLLFLQPIMEIGTKKLKHYEALIRLRGEDNTIIPPGIFIPVAEKFGLISEIDRFVFKEVLRILSVNNNTTIFMNISGISLTNNNLLEFFENSILESGIDSDHLNLGFEITETAATKNFEQTQSWMKKFKKLGCKIALDDFGVGYTSFSHLRLLPVDYIKIDGSFAHDIDKDSSHRAIVQAINTIAVSLGKNAIAEFVETESVLRVLREIGVKYGQGYHLGKPEPLNEKLSI